MPYSAPSDSEGVRPPKTQGEPELLGDPVIVPCRGPEHPLNELFHLRISVHPPISFTFQDSADPGGSCTDFQKKRPPRSLEGALIYPALARGLTSYACFAKFTHVWTCGEPRKYHAMLGPRNDQLSQSSSSPRLPSL